MNRRQFLAGAALAAPSLEPKTEYYERVAEFEVGGFRFYAPPARGNNVTGRFLAEGGPDLPPFEAFSLAAKLVFEEGLR